MTLDWKAVFLITIAMMGLHFIEYQRNGAITTLTVVVDSLMALILAGVMTAQTVEAVMIKVVNHFLSKYDLTLKEH